MSDLTSSKLVRYRRKIRFVALALFAVVTVGLAAACGGDAESDSPSENEHAPSVTLAPVSEVDAAYALDTVVTYLSGKSWGFFGATCDRWVELDYEFSPEKTGTSTDGATVVVFSRRPDRVLGSPILKFRVSPTGTVTGENKLERSGIAEGCDQW